MNRSAARGIIYSALACCYGAPDGGRSRWIAEGAWITPLQQAFGLLIGGCVDSALSWEALVLERDEGDALEMMRDCRRLFLDAAAPPASSPRLFEPIGSRKSQAGLFSGATAAKVRLGDETNGFPCGEEIAALPDRIATGFEFMGILAEREAKLAGAEKIRLEEVQMEFFSRFLLPWVPLFCERVLVGATRPFYRCLADLTCRFIDFEKNYLAVTEEGKEEPSC